MFEDDEYEEYGPTITRRRLGMVLRRLRERAGMSLNDATKALELPAASLSRMENGQQGVNVHLAKSMLDVYDEVAQHDEILDLCRRSHRKGWWQAYGPREIGYVGLEHDAESVREFQPLLVPGIFQTKEYAHATF